MVIIDTFMKLGFYTSGAGRSYIEYFLNQLPKNDRATILSVFEDIKQFGLSAIGCQFRHMEGKLWEIKIKTQSGGYRFFYVLLDHETMMVLHAYKKQGQKTPIHELDIARKRLKEVLS